MTKNPTLQIPRQNRPFFNGVSKNLNLFYLGDLGFFRKGKGISNKDLLETGHPCVTYGMLYTKYHGKITKIHSFVNKEISENSAQSTYGEILFPGSGETIEEIGKASVNLIDDPICVGGDTIIFKCDYRVDPVFLSYLLNSNIYFIQTRRLGQGHSVVHIYSDDLKDIIIPLPPLPEQKKIAEILSTWDEAIELENQKIVFKKQYRDSFVKMMILRLEKKHKLTTTAQRIKSFLIESRDRVGNNDITPVAVGVNGIRLRTEIYSKELSSDYSNNKILRANDICFGIGTDQIVYGVLLSKNIYSVSPAYRVFNIVGIDPFYLKCYLDTKNTIYSKKYMIISARQGKSVNIKGLLNEMIIVPPLAVQQQFSKVVTEMDNEIQLLEKERDLLNTQKQGLMQRLLTGKVRVKLD